MPSRAAAAASSASARAKARSPSPHPQCVSSRQADDETASEVREATGQWSSIDVGPQELYAKMVDKGPGQALLFHINELRDEFKKVDADDDGYIGIDEMGTLLTNISDTDHDAATAIASIEKEQGIQRKGEDGAPLVFFEQWAKFENDSIRDKLNGGKSEGGFKFPWQ